MSVGGFRQNASRVDYKSRFLFYIFRNSAIIVDNLAVIFLMLTKWRMTVFSIGGNEVHSDCSHIP